MRYCVVEDVLVVPLGDVWAAYSPISGQTLMLNDECAAILEVLRENPGDAHSVASALQVDCGVSAEHLMPKLAASWQELIDIGFVRRCESASLRQAST